MIAAALVAAIVLVSVLYWCARKTPIVKVSEPVLEVAKEEGKELILQNELKEVSVKIEEKRQELIQLKEIQVTAPASSAILNAMGDNEIAERFTASGL